jgi:hypothetical protein
MTTPDLGHRTAVFPNATLVVLSCFSLTFSSKVSVFLPSAIFSPDDFVGVTELPHYTSLCVGGHIHCRVSSKHDL